LSYLKIQLQGAMKMILETDSSTVITLLRSDD